MSLTRSSRPLASARLPATRECIAAGVAPGLQTLGEAPLAPAVAGGGPAAKPPGERDAGLGANLASPGREGAKNTAVVAGGVAAQPVPRRGPYSAHLLDVAALGPAYAAKFWSRVDKDRPGGCWDWTGAKQGKGYGRYMCGGFIALTHRIAFELVNGPVPSGCVLDHLCKRPRCCNPAHLEVVSQRANVRRGKGNHCKRGHEFTPENTYYEIARYARSCKACRRAYGARRRAAKGVA